MLFEVTLVCASIVLGAIAYSRKMCWFCQVKYYYIGAIYHCHDIFSARYNKIGKRKRKT